MLIIEGESYEDFYKRQWEEYPEEMSILHKALEEIEKGGEDK